MAYVIGFWTTDNLFQPLGWSKKKNTNKMLKSIIRKKFKTENDFFKEDTLPYYRFYKTKRDMKKELPEI